MCYNTAAAAKAAAIQALRSGILILLIPVALLFIGIFFLVFRSKERFTEPNPEPVDCDPELRNWKFEIRDSKLEAGALSAGEIRDSSFEFRHPVPGRRTQP